MPKLPLTVLKSALNKKIRIRLKDNSTYEGLLIALDEYMNLALADTLEVDDNNNPKVRWGVTLIRGNNILWVEIVE
ncbi:MAG: LSM domain-containing protein [Candidatus Njordarchaeia archaeon]